jgi:hypothetical protein
VWRTSAPVAPRRTRALVVGFPPVISISVVLRGVEQYLSPKTNASLR